MKNCQKTISRAFTTLPAGWHRKDYCKNIVKQKDLLPKNYHLPIGSTEDAFQTSLTAVLIVPFKFDIISSL